MNKIDYVIDLQANGHLNDGHPSKADTTDHQARTGH